MHRSTSAGLLGVDTNNVTNGFLRAPDGSITTIDVPGAAGTLAAGINDPGRITGFYTDANGTGHGFLWTGEHAGGRER